MQSVSANNIAANILPRPTNFCQHVYCIFQFLPSVLWRCWLGGRKGIWPVKNWVVGVLVWLSVWSEVQTCIWPSWCHCHSLSLASAKSRLVLPFRYRLTRVLQDKGPLNGCVCVYCTFMYSRSCRFYDAFLWAGKPPLPLPWAHPSPHLLLDSTSSKLTGQ